MQIRRFSSEMKTLMPSPHVGMSAAPILFGREQVAGMSDEQMAARFNGLPILIDHSDAAVVALYFEPHARMFEHNNPRNTLFVVLRGQGFVRIGGPQGETRPLHAGDAVLWPLDIDHMVWTEDDALEGLAIELPTR